MSDHPSTRPRMRLTETEQLLAEFICGDLARSRGLDIVQSELQAQTPLFKSGIIDSMGILDLMGFVEKQTGRRIANYMVDMRYFGTIRSIAESFFEQPPLPDSENCRETPACLLSDVTAEAAQQFPQSIPSKTTSDLEHERQIDEKLMTIAASVSATPLSFPVLVSRKLLEKAGYDQSFPHLLFDACPHLPAANLPAADLPGDEQSEWCLSPAVCYHVYGRFAGQQLESNLVISTRGPCFRNEQQITMGRRQIEFQMREIVLLGAPEWIDETLAGIEAQVTKLLATLRIPGQWNIADDPFFLPTARGKALIQKLKKTKREFQTDETGPLALASINRHETFFSQRFDIRETENSELVHTACVAFGLDRWCHATAKQSDSKTGREQEIERIMARLRTRLPYLPETSSAETSLRSLDFDSLDQVEMLCALSDELGTHLQLDQFKSAKTIGDIIAVVETGKAE